MTFVLALVLLIMVAFVLLLCVLLQELVVGIADAKLNIADQITIYIELTHEAENGGVCLGDDTLTLVFLMMLFAFVVVVIFAFMVIIMIVVVIIFMALFVAMLSVERNTKRIANLLI